MRNESRFPNKTERPAWAARTDDRPGDRPEGNDALEPARDALWNIAGVAAYLRIPVSSIYKITARKGPVHIPHIRIGGKLRFRKADVDRWLTLLTVSNLENLARVREKALEARHGDRPQTQAP